MRRLPKGFGSIQKLSGSRRKPFAIRISTVENGKRRYKYIGYYATYKEAIEALTEYNKNPYDVNLATVTIADMWEIFKLRRFDKISKSGKNVYNAAYGHLKPIWNMRIRDLETYQLQTLIDNINRSWQTKSHAQTLLHQIFEMAMEMNIANKNYAEFIKLEGRTQSDMHKAFSREEITKLFNVVFTEPWADAVLITIYTGLRPTELLTIKTADVYINDRYMIGGIKTKAGKNRVIPINNKVLPFVRKRYNHDNEFLIEDNGQPVSYGRYRDEFKALMQSLGMEHLPHDGRHTFASMADTAGLNKVAIKRIMGHMSKDITEKTYTHKDIDELIQNIDML